MNAARRAVLGVTVAAIAVITACGRGGGNTDSTNPSVNAATAQGGGNKPPLLPDTLEQLYGTAEFQTFVTTQIQFDATGLTFNLPCTATTSAAITIYAADGSEKLRHSRDFDDNNGYIVAKLVNNGSCAPRAIPVAANGGTAYWVARSLYSSGAFDSRVVVVDDSITGGLGFNKCPKFEDNSNAAGKAEVRKYTEVCKHAKDTTNVTPTIFTDDDEISLWIACADGCCYTDRGAGGGAGAAPPGPPGPPGGGRRGGGAGAR
jgi:hypothetical protein